MNLDASATGGASVIDEVRRLLARRLPGYEVGSISGLGEGLDNAAYEVNGELIVRASKEPDPAVRTDATRREAALLAVVGTPHRVLRRRYVENVMVTRESRT
jgi:hypothetical protein